jgi:hypothetical protein
MSWPPPNHATNAAFGTGYRVTFGDFRHLIASPSAQPAIAALLQPWFGYDIVGQHETALVRSPQGQTVDLEALHHLIQSDPQKQFELYQAAMSLWR